jgi:hypothetical protein
MPAYNRLHFGYSKRDADRVTKYIVQFKFGNCRLFDYQMGDKLLWGGYEKGVPGKKRVVVHGVAESGEGISDDPEYWLVFIENDVIKSVAPDDGRYNFKSRDGHHLVLAD